MPRGVRKTPPQPNKRSATTTDVLIGQRVRARRMEMHLSQEELGDQLGVSFQQIQKYEKGVNRVGAARLQQLATALDTDMAYFMEDAVTGRATPSRFTTFLSTKDGMELMEAGMRLNHAQCRGIITLARTLSSSQ